ALADRGEDVLLVDLDAQGNATVGLGFESAYTDAGTSLYDVLLELDNEHRLDEVIRQHAEFDVAPAHVDMFNAEAELQTAMRGRERLWMALDELERKYEFVIVDAPPTLGLLTENALLACRNVLVPALAEVTSKHALDILFEHFETLESGYGVSVDPIGIVINRIEVDGEADRMIEWFEESFGDTMPLWRVRNRVTIKRALAHNASVFGHSERTDMAARFSAIAAHLGTSRAGSR
ncbi:MAG: ATPase involved in chromosome partitioning, partial [halophilic archaeon J07HX5]